MRFDRVLGSAEAISSRVEGASRVTRMALSTPVIKTVALATGTGKAARRLREEEPMMPKRVTWFVVGAAAGATGSVYAKRKARKAVERMQPTNVATGRGRAGPQLGPIDGRRPEGGPCRDAGQGGRAAGEPRPREGRIRTRTSWCPQGPTIVVVETRRCSTATSSGPCGAGRAAAPAADRAP